MRSSRLFKWGSIGLGLLLATYTQAQTTAPKMLGYQTVTNVKHEGTVVGDTFYVHFNGGQTVSSQHVPSLDPPAGSEAMAGFKYGVILSPNTFEEEMFVSKGYFPEYIQLSWEVVRFQSQITGFKIFRRELGSGTSFSQVANIANSSTTWKDEFAEAGVMYEYKLKAEGIFPIETPFLNTLEGIGFRLPSGKVSGRVTYEGGGAVEGVTLIPDTDDDFAGSSLELNGTDSYLAISPDGNDPKFKFDDKFAFQAWVKPATTGNSTIFQKGTQYKISHQSNQITFDANGTSLVLNFTQKVDTFFNVTAIRSADSLKLYVLYDNQTYFKQSVAFASSTPANTNEVFLGKSETNADYYGGVIDEVRIWYRSLTEKDVLRETFRLISGTEDSLAGYYRLNEGVGDNFYDLSRKGFTFNENHGFMSNVSWSTDVPGRPQLSVKGYTDANGNYLVTGIPYSSDGSTYRIVPAFGIHSFDPTERLLFIGPGSNVYSDVNFIDVASFPVTGEVFYKDTRFPVSGVQIKIDGIVALNSEGTPITTNSNGVFTIDVPIGKHQLQLEKYGHVFRNGGYFPDSLSNYDFQQPLTIQERFKDTTLVKVVGKVVGGPVEAAKPQGMGKTVNNIGNSKIIMSTQREWDLREISGADRSGTWNNEYFHHEDSLTTYGTTAYEINDLKPKEIEIRPDSETGEYVAYLLPERYVIKSVVAGNPDAVTPKYTFDNSYHTVLDLTSSYIKNTEVDSIIDLTDISVNQQTGDTIYGYNYDSLHYYAEKSLILRENPSVTMTSPDKTIERFWEDKFTTDDGDELSIVSGDDYGQWKTPVPVFLQRGIYKTKIVVFEQYENIDNGMIDNVPVIDGTVRIQNGLAIDTKINDYELNEFGELDYEFLGGLPNIASGGAGDFLKTMTVKVFTGQNGSIVTNWPSDGNGFKGYLFGGMPTGNNFVTTGPNVVDMILRDPYGTNSYSYFEEGSSYSRKQTYVVEDGIDEDRKLKASLGLRMITFAGVGVGTIADMVFTNDLNVGVKTTSNWVDNNSTVVTTTNTKKWSTSSTPNFVGAEGDLFIGHSTNIVYGKNTFVEIIPNAACGPDANCLNLSGDLNGYSIGLSEGIRLNPEFNTGFQYTQNHIENYLIPQLEDLRDNFLVKKAVSGEYEYVIQPSDPDFGKSNDPALIVRRADDSGLDGDSYNINYPIVPYPDSLEYIDSVAWYNSQIHNWQGILERNEREKSEAQLIQNYSFDAGTVLESSSTTENVETSTDTYTFSINPSVGNTIGYKAAGKGFEINLSTTTSKKETETTTETEKETRKFGFVFKDNDEGDFYSIDVKDAGTGTGPVFAVRGGQSKCPYVDAEVSKYHMPGTILSEATMQREVPQVSVNQAIVNDVPQGKSANYLLYLSNIAETGDDAWYRLSIDESSIVGGTLSIDGAPITNGRTFYVPGGGTVTKTLNLTQAVPDSFRFENVKLYLHSLCQSSIADTVEISAYFQPACSEITITNPEDLWLMNTSDILFSGTEISSIPMNVGLNNYNLGHSTFESIAVQYKPSSSSQWISDMVYYVDQVDYDAASEPKTFINGNASLNYIFEMKSLQDRNYDVRLQTTCADGTQNTSETVSGIKDVKRPKLFGTPQPGDGILSPGDDIMITLDEDIQQGLLTSFNFSVRGVLNGADIAHNSVVFFDGVDDNISVIEGVKLTDKDFTVEFWAKRSRDGVNEVIFAQGELELGFNASNNFYAKFGTQTINTMLNFPFNDTWAHWAVAYDYDNKMVSVYMNDQIVIDNAPVTALFVATGRMYVGQNMMGANQYNGYLHDLRVWETTRGQGSVIANMNVTKSGDEVGLSGLWPMDAATGDIAEDLSRNHHGILNGATWAVFPRGYARTLSGSDYLTIPAGELIVTNEMDMTIEFWMKAGPQTNSVIFSNGKGDGTDISPPFENIWVIGADGSGKLHAMNNGTSLTVNKDVFDNEWHHVAVVVKRIGNTAIYIDGNQEVFMQSSNFGGLSGAQATLGARQFRFGGSYTYDRNFSGRLDEVRIWKLARTKKLLELDMNAKLQGNEVGLMAYYPFDAYDINLLIQPSLEDQVEQSTKVATPAGGTADNSDVPNIKDARPVQNVRYNWVVNEDQIIINVTEDPELIEKTVLEITVQDVEDLNENRMASPVTWTAYIRKNTVLWNEAQVNLEKKVYEPRSFQVEVLNLGGTEQNYTISNLPGWLSVNEAQGTLTPDSEKILTFTIDEGTNIGTYNQSIYLESDFGFREKLEINLKVKGDEPNWTVDDSQYDYNMSVVGILNIKGIISTNPDDIIAAFVDGELRGVANLQYVQAYDQYELFLDIYSNTTNGENVEFKVWNASEGKVYVDVTPELTFLKDNIIGSPSNPQEFIVSDNVEVLYALKKGWNWVSFHVNADELVSSAQLFSVLNSTEGDLIKTQGKFDQFGASVNWIGGITNQGGFSLVEGYKMKVAKADTFTVNGEKVETNAINIPLRAGWNWVGFPSELNMEVNDALANVNFENDDFIKGQNGFAIYDEFLGWIGSLNYLKPTKSYMIKSNAAHTLTYPDPALLIAKTGEEDEQDNSPWEVLPQDYAKDMAYIISSDLCLNDVDPKNDYLGVFVEEECRGYVHPQYVSTLNEYVFFLQAYANGTGEELSFKFYDYDKGQSLEANEKSTFSSDAIVGDIREPYSISIGNSKPCGNESIALASTLEIHAVPNPFNQSTQIRLLNASNQKRKIVISDMYGKAVKTYETSEASLLWDGVGDDGTEVKAGIYILSVSENGETTQAKLIKY